MNKIVPFKKEILFKTSLAEITSISLEHEITSKENNLVKGKFFISGEYKITDTSVNVEEFSYTLPFTVDLSEKYILDNITVDIDDFYYEIVNDNILSVNIDIIIDNLEEKKLEEEQLDELENELEEKTWTREELPIEQRCIEKEEDDKRIVIEDVSDIFTSIDNKETYKSYTVYIVREHDTVDSIIKKYEIAKEELEAYNDLENLKIGDKIIIPSL